MKERRKQFALCLDNSGNEESLVIGKVYRVLSDAWAAKHELVRIVDEEHKDYLYGQGQFVFVDFPKPVEKKILALAGA